MSSYLLNPSNRLRRTPFSRRVEAAGVKAYTVYNHMLIAQWFRSPEEDYAHLKSAVQVWDVAGERQVEVVGPDARRLVQMTTPRDLSRMADDQCYYIPMVDAAGRMLNDPVLVKLAPDRYWVSLADSDMLYYFKGLASGFGLDVAVFEPDVSPLAIQGPQADALVGRVFGREIVETRFFRHKTVSVEGKEMIIARSGWSLQGRLRALSGRQRARRAAVGPAVRGRARPGRQGRLPKRHRADRGRATVLRQRHDHRAHALRGRPR